MNQLFFNPFEKFQEKQLLIFGILGFITSSFLAFIFHFRFDGLIDAQAVEKTTWYQPIADQMIHIILLSIFLFIIGKIINPKTRLIDILNTVLIARIPFILILFSNINNYIYEVSNELLKNINRPEIIASSPDIFILMIFGILSILIIIWYFILLWNGFKIATYAQKKQHLISFIATFVFAYIISKIIFTQLITY